MIDMFEDQDQSKPKTVIEGSIELTGDEGKGEERLPAPDRSHGYQAQTLTGEMECLPSMHVPEHILALGANAVISYLIPPQSQQILSDLLTSDPTVILHRILDRAAVILSYEKLTALELGDLFYWLEKQRLWPAAAYRSFQEWCISVIPTIPYQKIREWILFYEVVYAYVENGLSPNVLLSPTPYSLFKLSKLKHQLECHKKQIMLKEREMGDTHPQLNRVIDEQERLTLKEVAYIVKTTDEELHHQMVEQHIASSHELQPLHLYIHGRLQADGFVITHVFIPATVEAWTALRLNKMTRKFQIEGIPDAMSFDEMLAYLQEHHLLASSSSQDESDEEDLSL